MKIKVLKKGVKVFNSNGISKVKITKDNKVQYLEIPIKSMGVKEAIDEFQKKNPAPTPPRVREYIRKGTPESKKSGIVGFAWVFDTTDGDYVKSMEEYRQQLGFKVLMAGLDIEIEGKDEEEKVKTLQESGITTQQLEQITNDIQSLTGEVEKETDADIKNV